jgi:hypothetical protein
MLSTMCTSCGYENSSFSADCEFCGHPLLTGKNDSEFRTGYPAEAQTVGLVNRAFEQPPPPPTFDAAGNMTPAPVSQYRHTCVKCGGGDGVEVQYLRKEYTPPLVYLSFLVSPLIMIILIVLLRVRHDINAPFCRECWGKYERGNRIVGGASLVFIGLLIAGFAAVLVLNSLPIFILATFLGLGIAITGFVVRRKSLPLYGKVDSKQVVIKDPVHGDIQFLKGA